MMKQTNFTSKEIEFSVSISKDFRHKLLRASLHEHEPSRRPYLRPIKLLKQKKKPGNDHLGPLNGSSSKRFLPKVATDKNFEKIKESLKDHIDMLSPGALSELSQRKNFKMSSKPITEK
jgi:hypothetical protein